MSRGVAPARFTFVVLILDGFITALLEVLYLPTYVGSVAVPVAVVFAAVINPALVFGAARSVDRGAMVGIPVMAWLIGFVLCLVPTTGGSVLLSAHENGRTLLLLACGLLPAFVPLAGYRVRGLRASPTLDRDRHSVVHKRPR